MSTKKITSIKVSKVGASPDVDTDFGTEIIGKVIDHAREIYGGDNVSNIVTMGKLKPKSAFKSMSTIYEQPFSDVNKITKLIPDRTDDYTFSDFYDPHSDIYHEVDDFRSATSARDWTQVIEGTKAIEGRTKNIGVHACGVLISTRPLYETIPLQYHNDNNFLMTQWNYNECESLGLIKMDFLGLDTVDLIQHTVENIMDNGKTPPNMLDIIHGNMDDEATFDLLRAGHTIGVFQLSSPGVRQLLRSMQPTTIDDIAATTALYRPGPMGMESHLHFAERKSGREKVEYPIHPEFKDSPLEDILGPTEHLCTYQEQIVQISQVIANMTAQEGDDLRKAMGKKKIAVMNSMKPKFFQGAKSNGYSDEAIELLWNTIAVFAEYGFNKAHSYSYAITAYQSAYLKTHYPVEFMSALLTQNIGNKDKIAEILQECRRMGLRVGNVDINESQSWVSPNTNTSLNSDIVYGFSAVKAVSDTVGKIITAEREANGAFTSLKNVVDRCVPRGVDRKEVYINLAHAGAFDRLGVTRYGAVSAIGSLVDGAKKTTTHGMSLFDAFDDTDDNTVGIPSAEYPYAQRLKHEADVIGMFLNGHPADHLGTDVNMVRTHTVGELDTLKRRTDVVLCGVITASKTKSSKRGKSVSVTIDDTTGFLDCYLSKELVAGMDKWGYQQVVKKNYCANTAKEVTENMRKMLTDASIAATPEFELNTLYKIYVTYSPSWGDSPSRATVTKIVPVMMDDTGRMPVRVFFNKALGKDVCEQQHRGVSSVAQVHPGTYPVAYAMYHSRALERDVDVDEMFVVAADVVNNRVSSESSGASTKKKKAQQSTTLQWPPPHDYTHVSIHDRDREMVLASLTYHKFGATMDKNTSVSHALNTDAGFNIGDYDFGCVMNT